MSMEQIFGGNFTFQVHGMPSEHNCHKCFVLLLLKIFQYVFVENFHIFLVTGDWGGEDRTVFS